MGKRGPKAQYGTRETNGRLSRKKNDVTKRLTGQLDQDEREMLRTGVEARNKMHGLKPEDCRDVRAGSFVGRLAMTGEITPQQYEAAKVYLEQYHEMAIAVRSPRQPGAIDLNATKGGSGDYENVPKNVAALSAWRAATAAIQDRQNQLKGSGALYAALQYCVLEDQELHHLIGWLREGLNALARHYRIGDKMKAA
ncbi:hypothetical protein [Devosia soli]|nr:hypothetical protein [Devosia soli]